MRLQRPIPRRRWSVGTDGTLCSPQVMEAFDTILLVLAMVLAAARISMRISKAARRWCCWGALR